MKNIKNIKNIIDRLVRLEERAARCYEEAARRFADDKELSAFFKLLAEDERYHIEVLSEAAPLFKGKEAIISHITLDEAMVERFERPFDDFEKNLTGANPAKKALFECVITAEFSEWNDLFLYIVSIMKGGRVYIPAAAELQQHKRAIERFLEADPELAEFAERLKDVPPVWRENILLVDDSESVFPLFKKFLKDDGKVESARNGQEALDKLSGGYFAAIISDVDMPVMDGLEFYRKAVERFPDITGRMLFYTGRDKHVGFFEENGLKYFMKPVSMDELAKAVAGIMKTEACRKTRQ